MLTVGILISALGLAVMIGWKTHNKEMVQIYRTYPGMQFNTALSVFFLGISAIALAFNKKFIVTLFSLLALCISTLTLLQYIFTIDFKIDQFFSTYDLKYPMAFPGRMAVNTALCISLSSVCLLMMNCLERTYGLVQLLSCVLLSISGIAVFGFIARLESSLAWSDFTRMGFQTAVGFFILGLAIFTSSAFVSFKKHHFFFITPLSVCTGMLLASFGIWQTFKTQEYLNFREISQDAAQYLSKTTESILSFNIKIFQRIAQRWNIIKDLPEGVWIKEKQNYLRDIQGLKDLQVIAYKDVDKDVLEKISQGFCYIENSNHGFITIYVPIIENDKLSEILIAKLDLIKAIEGSISNSIKNNYQLFVYDNGSPIAKLGNMSLPILHSGETSSFQFDELNYKFELFPLKQFFEDHRNALSLIVLYLGFGMSLLATMLAYFAQQFYKKKREAESASEAKGSFLANMSHEIRTPLNGIIGTTTLLNETTLDEKQTKYVQRINSSGKMLLNLICNILDLSKIEAGELTISSAPCNLETILKEVIESMRDLAKAKGLEFVVHYPKDHNFNVYSDSLRLKQIFTNLINNAIKFTKSGTVTVSMNVVKENNETSIIRFEIADTGIGIPKEKFHLLFHNFFQVDDSITRNFGGTGLGLAICKQLVEKLNGEIGVESKVGSGSTFWVQIPFIKNQKSRNL